LSVYMPRLPYDKIRASKKVIFARMGITAYLGKRKFKKRIKPDEKFLFSSSKKRACDRGVFMRVTAFVAGRYALNAKKRLRVTASVLEKILQIIKSNNQTYRPFPNR